MNGRRLTQWLVSVLVVVTLVVRATQLRADEPLLVLEPPESLEVALTRLEEILGRFTEDNNRQSRFVHDNHETVVERGDGESIVIVKSGIKTYGPPIRSGELIEFDVIESVQRKIYDVGAEGTRTLSRQIENHMTRRYCLHRERNGQWTFSVVNLSHSIPHFRDRPMRTGCVRWTNVGVVFVGFGTDYFFRHGGELELGAYLMNLSLTRASDRLVESVHSQNYELASGPDGDLLPMPDFGRPFGKAYIVEERSEVMP